MSMHLETASVTKDNKRERERQEEKKSKRLFLRPIPLIIKLKDFLRRRKKSIKSPKASFNYPSSNNLSRISITTKVMLQ
jgi:hypothetical protein